MNVHHPFGREEMLASVYVRTKFTSFRTELANARQGEYLEASAVGQHRTVKTIEFVQTTRFLQDFQTRTEIEVIRIAQNDFGIDVFFYFVKMYSFDATQRADRHKDGSVNLTVVSCDESGASCAAGIGVL